MKYKALFFDLDNTLLDFGKAEYKAIRKALELHNLPSSDEIAHIYSKINKSFWERYERGEIKREEIFENRFIKLLEVIGGKTDISKLSKDYFSFLSTGHDTVDGAKEILEWCVENGYKLYATTNGISLTQFKRIEESGLNKYFNGVFVSEQVGAKKPESAYFEYVYSKIEAVDKKEILVIGDSPSSDILGGINFGVDTCWYNPECKNSIYTPTFEIKKLNELKSVLKRA